MPLQNRVDPWGRLVAVADRGTLTGNRGVLHDADRQIVRSARIRRWIACELEFRGRERVVMTPNRYTELFFLDEATALAAGHRPCFECRRADALRFQECWMLAAGLSVPPTAGAMDDVIHSARMASPKPALISAVPDGAIFTAGDQAWLVDGTYAYRWSFSGYVERRNREEFSSAILATPAPIVALLAAGYSARLHPTISG